jgi:transcriptional regulator with XRE-family HTH domain
MAKQEEKAVVKVATKAKPYHYVGAGLPNVYLVGVTYRHWPADDTQSADIPALPALLDALAKALLEKRGLLNGDELRFLRKQLKIASKDFAPLVGVSVEQYSRLENGATVTPTVDRLVRLLYAAMMKLTPDLVEGVARATWTAKLNHEERIVASQDEEQRWVVRTKAA